MDQVVLVDPAGRVASVDRVAPVVSADPVDQDDATELAYSEWQSWLALRARRPQVALSRRLHQPPHRQLRRVANIATR